MQRFSLYEGVVVENVDPEYRNRVKVSIPGIWNESLPLRALPWASVLTPWVGPGAGEAKVLPLGSPVLVAFVGGSAERPVVIGSWISTLDTRNTSAVGYTAGSETKVVENDKNTLVNGDENKAVNGDVKVSAVGRNTRGGGSIDDTCKGARTITAGSESKTIKSLFSSMVGSVASFIYQSSVNAAIIGKTSISTAGGVEVTNADPLLGVKLTSFVGTILAKVITGVLQLESTDPTGLVRLAGLTLNSLMAVLESTTLAKVDAPLVLLGTGSTPATPVALSLLVDARIAEVVTAYNNHFHTDPVSGTTGTPTVPILLPLQPTASTVVMGV